jgi:hypothetical protein
VRLWHENGQLAEEMHVVKGRKRGPWLKFFADGSPRLEAEHREKETLVVKNAWDDQRRQVVKNGKGVYVDDGVIIDTGHQLSWKSGWTHASELRRGLPHGAGTTWSYGVLWSRHEFANGQRHGVGTLFYDNGRVRTRTTYRNGKAIKTEELPKFDHPRPAVLMHARADAELYEGWGHPRLDVYPTPVNLERIQDQLVIPTFLQEVFERNQDHALRDRYEDLNTFKDAATYFVAVNACGTVDGVEFSGSGVYSISAVNDYPPLIAKLKFEPGRIGQRKVPCRVLVEVVHTFVESG